MKGKKDIIALYYKIIEINLLKSRHGTHRKIIKLERIQPDQPLFQTG